MNLVDKGRFAHKRHGPDTNNPAELDNKQTPCATDIVILAVRGLSKVAVFELFSLVQARTTFIHLAGIEVSRPLRLV